MPTVPGIVARFHDSDLTVYEGARSAAAGLHRRRRRQLPATTAAVLDALAGADADVLRNHAFATGGRRACRLRPTRCIRKRAIGRRRSSITPTGCASKPMATAASSNPEQTHPGRRAGRPRWTASRRRSFSWTVPSAGSVSGPRHARKWSSVMSHVHVRGLRRRPPGIGRHRVDGRGAAAARAAARERPEAGSPEGEPAAATFVTSLLIAAIVLVDQLIAGRRTVLTDQALPTDLAGTSSGRASRDRCSQPLDVGQARCRSNRRATQPRGPSAATTAGSRPGLVAAPCA